jgi:hypothetical protein
MTLIEFLERDDVLVGLADGPEMVVHHKQWNWEGRGKNVIDAARMAMAQEKKYHAELFRDAGKKIGEILVKGDMELNLSTITIHARVDAKILHTLLLELKRICKNDQ